MFAVLCGMKYIKMFCTTELKEQIKCVRL